MLDSVSKEIKLIQGKPLRLFQDADAIAARVQEMGAILTETYQNRHPVVIGIMQGAFIFTADLVRAIQLPCTVDLWRISSYGNYTKSRQSITEIMPPTISLDGRHVILVEDIVDSGRTLKFLRQRLQNYTPKSVSVVSLVKVEGSPIEVDLAGFISNGEFIVGYGLDIANEFRGLSSLYYLDGDSQFVSS